jgi:TonB family protein
MAEIINYIWQSSFCLLFFFGVYWCFLREEKAFAFTRLFILFAPVLALLFPLIEIPVDFSKPSISLEDTAFLKSLTSIEEEEDVIGTFGLPEFTVKSSKLPLLMELTDYLLLGYLGIVLLLGLRLFWQFTQINLILRKGWYQTVFKLKGDYFLVPTFGLAPVFSFFDKLFWDDTQQLSPEEREQIVQHEVEHIRQGHSWDILYYQLLCVFFWFNPVIHLMRSALVDTHEYLADAHVLKRTENKESYRKLIVKIAFKGLDLPIGNYFIRSTTLKRIMMMKKSSSINWFKLLMVVPLTAMLLALVSMKTLPEGRLLGYTSINLALIEKQIQAAHDSIEVTTKVKRIKSPIHHEYISEMKDGKIIAQFGELQYEIGEISDNDEHRKVLEMLRMFRGNSPLKKEQPKDVVVEADKMPVPEGGMEGWNSFLAQNLKMPAQATELGVDGVVYAQFVVDKKGQITSPSILRSLGMGLDDEVLRILNLPEASRWTPGEKDGEPVNTLMTIPVKFKTETVVDAAPFFPVRPVHGGAEIYKGEQVFDVVEKMPQPQGGMEGWNTYLEENLQYPERAKQANIEGTVYVVFIVDKEGNLAKPEILRGIGAGADEEAIRLVNEAPQWIPGSQRGQRVHVKMRIPIRFNLGTNKDEQAALQQNTLKQVEVRSYSGSQKSEPRFLPAEKEVIDIQVQDEHSLLLFGKKTDIDELEHKLSERQTLYNANGVLKNNLVVKMSAVESVKLQTIHNIQHILREFGIVKVEYMPPHDKPSEVLIF